MKLRIVSDGTQQGTFVMDNDGKVVENVTAVTWSIGVKSGTATAQIVLTDIPVDVFGEGDV